MESMKWMHKGLAVLLCLCLLTGCQAQKDVLKLFSQMGQNVEDTDPTKLPTASTDLFAMDTYMSLTASGKQADQAVKAAAKEIERLDALFSTGKKNSEVSMLNRNVNAAVSEDLFQLLKRSVEIHEETGGAFDVTIYKLMKAWGFPDKNYRIPSVFEIQRLLPFVDASKIKLYEAERQVSLPTNTEIDLGGIVKGYASQRIMKIFKRYNITSGLVSLGGNVQACGGRADGSPWNVAVQDPVHKDQYLGILKIRDKCVITSGGYERYFKKNGKRWHHILDPKTGYPARSGLISVSIISEDGPMADGLSTALFIMGKKKALEYWKAHKEAFDAILVTEDGSITVTRGLSGKFTSKEEFKVCKG